MAIKLQKLEVGSENMTTSFYTTLPEDDNRNRNHPETYTFEIFKLDTETQESCSKLKFYHKNKEIITLCFRIKRHSPQMSDDKVAIYPEGK